MIEASDIKLQLDNISKSYDEKEILHDISIKVMKGEHVSVLGSSGCGKSTLMNIITGITDADGGDVSKNGQLGYMQQKDLLLPWKSCLDNVILPLTIGGYEKNKATEKALPYFDTFKLKGYEHSYPDEMSGGMRQRASLMRTFLSSEDILLLDEPFGAVDSITRGNLQQWLIDVTGRLSLTIFMITHDIDEALLMSDRIYIISDKPAAIRDEIKIDMHKDEKKQRLFDNKFLEFKRRILDDLEN